MTGLAESVVEDIEAAAAQGIDPVSPDFVGQPDSPSRVVEAGELAEIHGRNDLLIVDVRTVEQCLDGHIPGAVMLDYADLVCSNGTAAGQLPGAGQLSRVLSGIGLRHHHHVVAYNDDSGSHAARLLWSLDVLGHRNYSLLNGGFASWDELDLPVADEPRRPAPSDYFAVVHEDSLADFKYVKSVLGRRDTVLLDTRSPEEYEGKDVRAARGGHIPGAVNFDWLLAVDLIDNGRMRDEAELLAWFRSLGVTPDKEIIPYCHSHHRSAHTWFVLKHLGFPRVRPYAGSWSEWGNRDDAPVETGLKG